MRLGVLVVVSIVRGWDLGGSSRGRIWFGDMDVNIYSEEIFFVTL